MPEPYAGKLACAVLGELCGGDAAWLPGAVCDDYRSILSLQIITLTL